MEVIVPGAVVVGGVLVVVLRRRTALRADRIGLLVAAPGGAASFLGAFILREGLLVDVGSGLVLGSVIALMVLDRRGGRDVGPAQDAAVPDAGDGGEGEGEARP